MTFSGVLCLYKICVLLCWRRITVRKRGKQSRILHVISILSVFAGYHSSLCPFVKWARTWNTGEENGLTSITLSFSLSQGEKNCSVYYWLIYLPERLRCPVSAMESTIKSWSLNGALLFTLTYLSQAQLCVSFLKRFNHKSRVAAPSLHYHSKELPYCRSTCEWKSSFLLITPSRVHCACRRWWVGVLRWHENWNGTPRSNRLHAVPS